MLDFILKNKEWLFSGIGISLLTFLGWLIWPKKEAALTKTHTVIKANETHGGMQQNATNQSGANNSQTVTIHNYQELNTEKARELITSLFNERMPSFVEKAQKTVLQRSNHYMNCLLKVIAQTHPEIIEAFEEPIVQDDIFNAQKDYALHPNDETLELRISALIEKINTKDNQLKSTVLKDVLLELPALTKPQISALTLIYILRNVTFGVQNIEQLISTLKKTITPLLPDLNNLKTLDLMHLSTHRCVEIGEILSYNFFDLFLKNYPGFFCEGFEKNDFLTLLQNNSVEYNFLTNCLQNKELFQINAVTNRQIEQMAKNKGFSPEITKNIVALQNSKLMSPEKTIQFLKSKSDFIQSIMDIYENSSIKNSKLTLIGIALAELNFKNYSDIVIPSIL